MRLAIFFKENQDKYLLITMSLYLATYFLPLSSKQSNNFFYIVVLIPFVLLMNKKIFKYIFKSKILKITIFLFVYLLLVSIFISGLNKELFFDFTRNLISFLVFYVGCVYLFDKSDFKKSINFVGLWAVIWGLFTIVTFYLQNDFSTRLRYVGPADHEIIGASVYAVMCVFILFSQQNLYLPLRLVAGLSLFVCVLLSGSRGPTISLVLALLFGSMWLGKKRFVLTFSSVAGVLALLYLNDWFSFSRFFQSSSGYRLQIWQQIFSDLWQQGEWFFGRGLMAERSLSYEGIVFDHAHSSYVTTFLHGGVVGLTILIILMILAGFYAVIIIEKQEKPLAASVWVFAIMIILTDSHKLLSGPDALWIYFWLPLAYLSSLELKSIGNSNSS